MENINLNQKPPSPTSSNIFSVPSINQPSYPQQQQHYFSIPAANSQPSQLHSPYPYQSFQDISSHPYSYSFGQNNNNNNMMMMNSLVLPLTPPLNPHLTTQQQPSSSGPLPQAYHQQHPLDINDPYSIYYQTITPAVSSTAITTGSTMMENSNPHPTTATTTFSSCTMGKNLSSNTNITPLEEENRTLNDVGKGIPLNQLHPEAIIYMIEFKSRRIDFFYFDFHQQQQMILNSPSTTISSTSSHLSAFSVGLGDLVIVEADRGKDLGKVAMIGLTSDQVLHILKKQQELKQEQMKAKMNQSTTSSSTFEKGQQQQQEEDKDEEENNKKEDIDDIDDDGEETKKELLLQEPIEIVPEQIFIKRIYRLATPEEINMLLIKSQDEQRALVICQQKVKQRKLQMEVVDAEYQW